MQRRRTRADRKRLERRPAAAASIISSRAILRRQTVVGASGRQLEAAAAAAAALVVAIRADDRRPCESGTSGLASRNKPQDLAADTAASKTCVFMAGHSSPSRRRRRFRCGAKPAAAKMPH